LLLVSTGCSVVLPLSVRPALSRLPSDKRLTDTYRDYVGVMHVHTTYSHDAHGTVPDVVRVANAQRLDYAVLTEHNNLQALRDGHQGWHGGTLLLVGEEVSTPGGHYLALNITEEIDRHKLTTQQVIDEVNRQGGLGFIAHPFFKKRPWTDWTVSGMTGIEAYNVAHDTLDENRLRLVAWTLTAPPNMFYLSLIDRPYDPLRLWDTLIQRHGRMTGIGSTDAHEFHAVGLNFASYEIMFQLIRTHLLIPSSSLTPEGVYDALRAGHAYLAIELMVPAKGFVFFAEREGQMLGIMGDAVEFVPGLALTAILPAPASFSLWKDGQETATRIGQQWHVPVTEPGTYRLEASRHNTPWIMSNPIYVTPAKNLEK
jgi:hypothetical protein